MIYFASKVRHAPRWRAFRAAGVPVNSTWIDEPNPPPSISDLWDRCIREAVQAHVLVAYNESDETLKGALVEAGAALATGVDVFWVGPVGQNTFTNHSRVFVYAEGDLDSAIAEALDVVSALGNKSRLDYPDARELYAICAQPLGSFAT